MHRPHLLVLTAILWFATSAQAPADTIRVGTTGDYAPLTVYDAETGAFSGKSITMVEAFAAAEEHEITFVRTTWPDLMTDLEAGRFDMAIGGITWTEDRAARVLTSDAIETFGKVALSRCAVAADLSSLDAIDRRGVRVVSNRGGTNERFALAHIRHATLTILPDNFLPFDYLRAEVADVMFTDSTEAEYLADGDPRLCVSAGPFTKDIKVALFARDDTALRTQFNHWLATRPAPQ